MKTRAAILTELGQPLELREIEIPELEPGQTLIDIEYSAICHTQILEARGYRGDDPYLPHCLGHEGSGTVLEVGPDVTRVQPGDRVLLSWIKGSGINVPGTTYDGNGTVINAGGITTFSEQSVISENRLTQLPDSFPMMEAALVGCAVATGCGVVKNTLNPEPGSSIVIFGTGGIGLFAVQAARIAGCDPIIAVDLLPDKLDVAEQLGATETINASKTDSLEYILDRFPDGLDYAIESSGQPSVMNQALESVRPQGGTAAIVGNAPHGQTVPLDPGQLNQGKRLLGTWGGDNEPDNNFHTYLDWVAENRLELEPFLSDIYSLSKINQALDDLDDGRVLRPLIDCSGS